MKANDKTRITAAEMRFMRTTAKCIWCDYKRNDDILKELKTETVMRKILKYKTIGFNMLIECREIGSQYC
jgi:hypothetical protein